MVFSYDFFLKLGRFQKFLLVDLSKNILWSTLRMALAHPVLQCPSKAPRYLTLLTVVVLIRLSI